MIVECVIRLSTDEDVYESRLTEALGEPPTLQAIKHALVTDFVSILDDRINNADKLLVPFTATIRSEEEV